MNIIRTTYWYVFLELDPSYHDMFDEGNYRRRKRMRRHAYKTPGGYGMRHAAAAATWETAARMAVAASAAAADSIFYRQHHAAAAAAAAAAASYNFPASR